MDEERTKLSTAFAAVKNLLGELEGDAGGQAQQEIISKFFEIRESPGAREMLKRAAVLGAFDARLFHEVLQVGISPDDAPLLPFEEFVRHDEIARVPRADGWHRLKESARKKHFDSWRESELRAFSRSALAYYNRLDDAARAAMQLDVLSLLILGDPKAAQDLFVKLYEQADGQFDLARCYALLQILNQRETYLSRKLDAERKEKGSYYEARALFAEEFYKTASFFERAEPLRMFEEVLDAPADSPQWILNLYATGGMGKTIFLRWIIARFAVVEPRRIPTARVDFDFLNLAVVNRHPWLVLLPIIEQLNAQLPEKGFSRLLVEYRKYRPTLRRPDPLDDAKAMEGLSQGLERVSERERETFADRFASVLSEANLDTPVLIMLDTLEEAIYPRPESLMPTIRVLDRLRARCSPARLRLVLAGRYDLSETQAWLDKDDIWHERVPDFAKICGAQTLTYQLARFSVAEARRYLIERRGLSEQLPLEAVIRLASGNPFTLALCADLLIADDSLTEEDFKDRRHIENAYLIHRIILRLPDLEIIWLLRYGVVPRQLTYDFIANVMAAPIRREMKRLRVDDEKETGNPHDEPVFSDNLNEGWLEDEQKHKSLLVERIRKLSVPSELDMPGAWQRLRAYASPQGWISFVPGDDALRFHPEVLNPMRRLLQRQPIFIELHRTAVTFFESQAEAEPQRWVRATREAIYHRFQLEGAPALAYWQDKMRAPQAIENPGNARELAEEITGSEYINEHGAPHEREDGALMITKLGLAEAHFVMARAVLSLSHLSTDTSVNVSEAVSLLQRAKALQKEAQQSEAGVEVVSLCVARLIAAARRSGEGETAEAVAPDLEAARLSARTDDERLLVEIQTGEVFSVMHPQRAAQHFKAALLIRQRMKLAYLSPSKIRGKLAEMLMRAGDIYESQRAYKEALIEAQAQGETEAAHVYRFSLLNLLISNNQLDQAAEQLHDAEKLLDAANEAERVWIARAQAEMLFLQHDPVRALERVEANLGAARDERSRAAMIEMRGRINGALLRVSLALDDIETACQQWMSLGAMYDAERCRAALIFIHLRKTGNMREAGFLLNRSGAASSLDASSSVVIGFEQLRLEWLWRTGDETGARVHWAILLKQESALSAPQAEASLYAIGLALHLSEAPKDDAARLLDALERIEPPAARLRSLSYLSLAPTPIPAVKRLRAKVLTLMPRRPASDNLIAHALVELEALRCFGARPEWQALLAQCVKHCLSSNLTFALGAILWARDNWRDASPARELDLFKTNFLEQHKDYLALCATARIEQARRALENKMVSVAQRERCAKFLADARADLAQTSDATPALRARLEEVEGLLARASGEPKQANMRFAQATAIYNEAENRRAAQHASERMLAHTKGSSGDPRIKGGKNIAPIRAEPAFVDEDVAFTCALRPEKDSLRVRWRAPDGVIVSHAVSRKENPIINELLSETSSVVAYHILKRFAYDPSIFREFGLITMPARDAARAEQQSGVASDLKLDVATGTLSAIPWELIVATPDAAPAGLSSALSYIYRAPEKTSAAITRRKTRWLQSALKITINAGLDVDGFFGPATRGELIRFQKTHDLPPSGAFDGETKRRLGDALRHPSAFDGGALRVLIFEPSPERQLHAVRSIGVGISFQYAAPLFKAHSVFDPSARMIGEVLKEFQPHVVHICGTLKESQSSREIYLDFARRESDYESDALANAGSSAELLSPARLSRLLDEAAKEQLLPFLILDVLRPSGLTEAALQLFLRNAFAADLFSLGKVWTVLATGLAESTNQERLALYDRITNGLKTRSPSGDIANEARNSFRGRSKSLGALNFERSIASLGIALFTHDPALPLLAI